jgi:hypothetical protein
VNEKLNFLKVDAKANDEFFASFGFFLFAASIFIVAQNIRQYK